ncbi:MAG TPA: peptidase T4, partial [Hyphomicrobiales bacterium]|nr:peptidase T4 [Hyphomicrobiales bacterium]
AANCLSRAIARGVYEATSLRSVDKPAWRDRFGGQ